MRLSGIRNFINRRFKVLEQYIDLENKNSEVAHNLEYPALVNEDVFLGVYRNGEDIRKAFFLSEKGVYYYCSTGWEFFSYNDIVDASVGKEKLENREILIYLKNGKHIQLLIEGRKLSEDKKRTYCDIYDFLTFFISFRCR